MKKRKAIATKASKAAEKKPGHERQKRGRPKINEQVVRCPYCVVGDHFVPMLPRAEGRFTCLECGHTAIPDKPEFKCSCHKCGELNRAA